MTPSPGYLEKAWRLRHLLPEPIKRRIRQEVGAPDLEVTLRRMRKKGFEPTVVVDAGAYRGEWTGRFKSLFPDARVLMVEPLASRRQDLEEVASRLPGVALAPPVLLGGAQRDSVVFYEAESVSSVLAETSKTAQASSYHPMTTLDDLTHGTPFEMPDFLKLDVQGYELEVLKGATRALGSVEAVLMEVNLLPVYAGAPLFHEVVRAMEEWGFQIYDICGLFRRPYDGAVWQMDVVFVRSTSALVAEARWE